MSEDRTKYVARAMPSAPPLSRELTDFLHRRTSPFLDVAGLQTRPLPLIVQEAYMQGFADALNALPLPPLASGGG